MEGSSHFNVPQIKTDDADFEPFTKLPTHLQELEMISSKAHAQMTPVMKAILGLTDKMTLRVAALPQPE